MDIIRPSIETKELLDHYLQYNHYRGCEFSAANSLFWCDFYQTKFTIFRGYACVLQSGGWHSDFIYVSNRGTRSEGCI